MRDHLEEKDLGALLCLDMDNIRYLTSTHLAEWARDKFVRWCVLPRGGAPVLFERGSAAQVKRELCPWLKPENIRVATCPSRELLRTPLVAYRPMHTSE